ncbi:MAG: C25 family cysteine peptidase [Planctomycetota bacterium]
MLKRCHLVWITGVVWIVLGTTASAVDVVVVCDASFREAMQPWTRDREEQGLDIAWVAPQVSAVRQAAVIRDVADEDTKNVLLVGAAPVFGSHRVGSQIPMFREPTTVTRKFQSTLDFVTDRGYADLNRDGSPDAAVGRLPVRTVDELRVVLGKILRNDRSLDFGTWRRNVELVGGVGGFGPLIDTTIETVTRSILTASLPKETSTGLLYASPGHRFFPRRRSFREAVVKRYQSDCRFWVYAGHGRITELDRFPRTRLGRPILDGPAIGRLPTRDRPAPIALLLACYTGALDAPERSFADQWVTHPGGPTALIAGSRVTMPYGNASLALRLIDGIYTRRDRTLGESWVRAIRSLEDPNSEVPGATGKWVDSLSAVLSPARGESAAERLEHASLYQLLGDPTMKLHPPRELRIDAPRGIPFGEVLNIEVESDIAGTLTLGIDRPLGSDAMGRDERGGDEFSNPNERTLLQCQHPIRAGVATTITLDLKRVTAAKSSPSEDSPSVHAPSANLPSGWVQVWAHVAGDQAWAAGAVSVNIRDQEKPTSQ